MEHQVAQVIQVSLDPLVLKDRSADQGQLDLQGQQGLQDLKGQQDR
jgi:hypothetical protein